LCSDSQEGGLPRQAASLWQLDFLSQKILTTKGIRDAFILVFLHVETRRVILSPATLNPDEAWVNAQANKTDWRPSNDGTETGCGPT
jgi:hypothetical protein